MNVELVNQYISDSGLKLCYIAKQLGITYVALHNKMIGKYPFTLQELTILRDLLKLDDDQWNSLLGQEVVYQINRRDRDGSLLFLLKKKSIFFYKNMFTL